MPSAAQSDDCAASVAHYKKMYDRISALGQIGVWECELPSERISWTDTIYDLFEMERGTPIDRAKTVQMYEPESRVRLEKVRSEAMRNGTGFTVDAKIRTAQGRLRWIRITAEVERENGHPIRIFGTKQDITSERETLEQVNLLQTELIHVSRVNAMSAMASTLAHELNQPLTAINNYLVAARRMAEAQPMSQDFASCIAGAGGSAMRAGEIIRRLREMTIRGHTRHEAFGVRAAVDEAVALAATGRHDLEVTCDIDPAAQLIGDRIQIQQVLLNLIQNSYEAACGGRCRISIGTSELPGEVMICVTDNGPGISPNLLPNIFDSLVTTKVEGMGIGLSVSRTIVENHGGHIVARNEPDGGATVCFILPTEDRQLMGAGSAAA